MAGGYGLDFFFGWHLGDIQVQNSRENLKNGGQGSGKLEGQQMQMVGGVTQTTLPPPLA